MWRGNRRMDDFGPTYLVEHLATFGVGPQFGLQWPVDGIRKLKQMERSSAIWAQKMILKLTPSAVVLEDENGDLVEQFPLHLVSEPSAHLSTDSRDVYNNLLVFVVNEDKQYNRSPTEMHIFNCVRISAKDVAEDIGRFLRGRFGTVKRGRTESVGFLPLHSDSASYNGNGASAAPVSATSNGQLNRPSNVFNHRIDYDLDQFNMGFEKDVNTLNRCFDDIERFVARIQTAALAQRDLETLQQHRRRDPKVSKFRTPNLQARAQLPMESEFVEIFKKFKHCFNILAKLRAHIHEPNAPELLHFLFTPLTVILDACQWGLGRNIAPQVVSPLITKEATNLLDHSLTSKEYEVWNSLGEAWKTPPEDWRGPSPAPFTPIFTNGFGPPSEQKSSRHLSDHVPSKHVVDQVPARHLGDQVSQGHHSVPSSDRLKDQDNNYKSDARHLADREKYLNEKELKLARLQKQLKEEQLRVRDMMERVSLATPDRDHYPPAKPPHRSNSQYRETFHQESSANSPIVDNGNNSELSKQKAFLENLKMKRAKVAQVTYDRVGQNVKELTVSKDEYLEILNDTKNWWECRNVNNRIGFVPNTILHLAYNEGVSKFPVETPISVRVPHASPSSGPPSASVHNSQDHNGYSGRGERREWSSYSDFVTNEKRTRRSDVPY